MAGKKQKADASVTARHSAMFDALGSQPRLRIMQALMSAHPDGLFVAEIQKAMRGTTPSTLSHHLVRLKKSGLITVTREATYLRYRADLDVLRRLMGFFYNDCCRILDTPDDRG